MGYNFVLTGFPSCVANALGYLSNSGRTFNRDALKKDLNNLPFVDRFFFDCQLRKVF